MQKQILIVISIIGLVVGRDINNAGLSLIKEMEGWEANYYYDQIVRLLARLFFLLR